MKKYILPLLAASVAASPALAAPSISFTQSTPSNPTPGVPGYANTTPFETFEAQASTTSTQGAAFNPVLNAANDASIGATESTTGARVYSAQVPGLAADTDSNPNNKYLSVLGGTTYTVTFASPVQFFSFIIGSIDSYNNVKLTLSDGTVVGGPNGLSGGDIIGQTVTFDANGNSQVAGRVNYNFGGGAGLASAVFSSTRDSLEIDDLAAAAPEAATWAMMMVGLGIAGGSLRRRKAKVAVSYAAA